MLLIRVLKLRRVIMGHVKSEKFFFVYVFRIPEIAEPEKSARKQSDQSNRKETHVWACEKMR